MMQALLCHCKQRIFLDETTGHKFADSGATMPHKCQPNPIPLFEMFGSVKCDRREESIARDVTAEALRVGLDAFNVRTYRKGDYLILRQ